MIQSYWMIPQSAVVRGLPPTLVSSANFDGKYFAPVSNTLMCFIKRSDSSTNPCGTWLVARPRRVLLVEKYLLVSVGETISYERSQVVSYAADSRFLGCGTLTKAFWKSGCMMSLETRTFAFIIHTLEEVQYHADSWHCPDHRMLYCCGLGSSQTGL